MQSTMAEIQTKQTAADGRMTEINEAFDTWSTSITNAETNSTKALEDATTAKSTAESAAQKASVAGDAILNFNETIANIYRRLEALEKKGSSTN